MREKIDKQKKKKRYGQREKEKNGGVQPRERQSYGQKERD